MSTKKPYSVTLNMAQVYALALEKFRDQYSGSVWSKLAYIFRRIMFFARSWLFDMEYHTIPLDMLEEAMEVWAGEYLPYLIYQGEVFDCDDFARHFTVWLKDYITCQGLIRECIETPLPVFNGVGLGLGYLEDKDGNVLGGHAWAVVLVTVGEEPMLVYVEPQTGEVMWDNESREGYKYILEAVII